MMKCTWPALILIGAALLPGMHGAYAQAVNADSAAAPSGAALTILADIDSALVFIDSLRTGRTPLVAGGIAPGMHVLRLSHPDEENWLTGVITDSIMLEAGQHRTLRYEFEKRYLVTSVPSGAEVMFGDSLIGTTPLLARPGPVSPEAFVLLDKPGYERATLRLSGAQRGVLSTSLRKQWQHDGAPDAVLNDTYISHATPPRLYITGATTILLGGAAAYFKIRADDRYTLYRQTGVGSYLSETHRMDTAAAIALVATQISLGLFTYFILSE